MSITNGPAIKNTPSQSGSPSKPKNDPMEKAKERRLEQLQKQKQKTEEQIKKLNPIQQGQKPGQQPQKPGLPKKFASLSDSIRLIAHNMILAQEPEELFNQIRPLLVRIKVPLNKVLDEKIKLTEKVAPPKNSLYYIPLRRDTIIDDKIIKGIQSQLKFFHSITWNMVGLELWLRYPYKEPAGEETTTPIVRPAS